MGPTIAGAIGEAIHVPRGTLLAPPAPHTGRGDTGRRRMCTGSKCVRGSRQDRMDAFLASERKLDPPAGRSYATLIRHVVDELFRGWGRRR